MMEPSSSSNSNHTQPRVFNSADDAALQLETKVSSDDPIELDLSVLRGIQPPPAPEDKNQHNQNMNKHNTNDRNSSHHNDHESEDESDLDGLAELVPQLKEGKEIHMKYSGGNNNKPSHSSCSDKGSGKNMPNNQIIHSPSSPQTTGTDLRLIRNYDSMVTNIDATGDDDRIIDSPPRNTLEPLHEETDTDNPTNTNINNNGRDDLSEDGTSNYSDKVDDNALDTNKDPIQSSSSSSDSNSTAGRTASSGAANHILNRTSPSNNRLPEKGNHDDQNVESSSPPRSALKSQTKYQIVESTVPYLPTSNYLHDDYEDESDSMKGGITTPYKDIQMNKQNPQYKNHSLTAHQQSSDMSLSTATQSHDVRMPMYLPNFRPATGCTNASDFIVRCFVARLRAGITVVKHGRSRWCKSRLRILHVHNDGRCLSWKPAIGEPGTSKRPPRLDLTTCSEVRHAWSPDPLNPMFTGTPILRQKCESTNAFKSFALIFPKRTVDITAVTADQCKVLMEGFSALCFRLHMANMAGGRGMNSGTGSSGVPNENMLGEER